MLGGSVGVGSVGGSEVLSVGSVGVGAVGVGSVGGAPWTHARKPTPRSRSAASLVSCGAARHVHTLGRGRW